MPRAPEPPRPSTTSRGAAASPYSGPPRLDVEAGALLLEVPADWDAVCRAGMGLAREWQAVVRRALEAAFARGYAAVDCRLKGAGRAVYVLRREEPAAG